MKLSSVPEKLKKSLILYLVLIVHVYLDLD